MSDDMVDRVKAATAAEYKRWSLKLNRADGRIVALHGDMAADLGTDREEAEALFQDMRETALARAAIAALREPTPEMTGKGERNMWPETDARHVWQVMLDAALHPSPPSPMTAVVSPQQPSASTAKFAEDDREFWRDNGVGK